MNKRIGYLLPFKKEYLTLILLPFILSGFLYKNVPNIEENFIYVFLLQLSSSFFIYLVFHLKTYYTKEEIILFELDNNLDKLIEDGVSYKIDLTIGDVIIYDRKYRYRYNICFNKIYTSKHTSSLSRDGFYYQIKINSDCQDIINKVALILYINFDINNELRKPLLLYFLEDSFDNTKYKNVNSLLKHLYSNINKLPYENKSLLIKDINEINSTFFTEHEKKKLQLKYNWSNYEYN